MKRICHYCGKEYDGDPGSITCPDCTAKVRSTSILDRICVSCGCSFPGGPSAKFCPNCRQERRRKVEREYRARKRAGKVRPLGSTDLCVVCGKPYTVTGGNQQYCPKCAPVAIREKDRAKSREWNQQNMTPEQRRFDRELATAALQCVVCGNIFYPNSRAITCSPECSRKLHKLNHSKWEKTHAAERNAYHNERHRKMLADMTPEQREIYRQKENARARENYRKRMQKKESLNHDE